MVVKFQDTVVANVAVACPWRPENHASFAKFKREKLGAVAVVYLLVGNFG